MPLKGTGKVMCQGKGRGARLVANLFGTMLRCKRLDMRMALFPAALPEVRAEDFRLHNSNVPASKNGLHACAFPHDLHQTCTLMSHFAEPELRSAAHEHMLR